MSDGVELQRQLPEDPVLRDRLGQILRRPPLSPSVETQEERALAHLLPRDAHAEQCALGACFVHKSAAPIVGLRREDFFYIWHQRLAGAILDLAENHRPVNLETMRSFLNADVIGVPREYFLLVMNEYLADVRNKNSPGLR